MREVNKTESDSVIDNLRSVNENLEAELAKLKVELEDYKKRDMESATRYESISRTLLAARESADELTRQTREECETRTAETTAQCQQMLEETKRRLENLSSGNCSIKQMIMPDRKAYASFFFLSFLNQTHE